MTGVTSQLASHQVEELLAYSDGKPRRPERRPDSLLRRGLLMSVGKHGETKYLITEFGRAALHEHGYETPRLGPLRKRLVLTDEAIGVKVYCDNHGGWWVQFIGSTKWGRRHVQPAALDIEVRPEGATVSRLVVHG